jgi:Protein of unknown function (DUF4199)
MKAFEWKWGGIIGAAGILWLVASWALGFHERGIGMIQVTAALSIVVALVGYFFAMRDLRRREAETSLIEAVRRGALIAVIAAVLAVLGQAIYFKVINPGWTDYMVEQSRLFYADQGVDEKGLAEIAESAKATFGLASYATQAGVGALLQGVLFSALAFGILKWHANR